MHNKNIFEQGEKIEKAEKAMVLLHGRGAPASDILSLTQFFDVSKTYVAAPQAANYTWYPYSFLTPEENNQPWLDSAIEVIGSLISDIEKSIPTEKIYIMGFSQGACLTSEITARNAKRYGGIAIFTGGLIGEKVFRSKYSGDFMKTPVYISNGDNDPHVPLDRTMETENIFKELNAGTTTQIFPGRPHTIEMKEINKVKELLGF